MNKVYDERQNLKAARAFERQENKTEVQVELRSPAQNNSKRTPAPAPGVAETRTPKRVTVQTSRRSSRIQGVSADAVPDTPWYDRVAFTTPISGDELRAWLAIMWRSAIDTPNEFRNLWATDRGVNYLFASRVMSRDRAAEI